MNTYCFAWNGRRRFIDADNMEDAIGAFMERYGFYPDNANIYKLD